MFKFWTWIQPSIYYCTYRHQEYFPLLNIRHYIYFITDFQWTLSRSLTFLDCSQLKVTTGFHWSQFSLFIFFFVNRTKRMWSMRWRWLVQCREEQVCAKACGIPCLWRGTGVHSCHLVHLWGTCGLGSHCCVCDPQAHSIGESQWAGAELPRSYVSGNHSAIIHVVHRQAMQLVLHGPPAHSGTGLLSLSVFHS